MSAELAVGIDPGTNGGWVVMDSGLKLVGIGPKSGSLYDGHMDAMGWLRADLLSIATSAYKTAKYALIEQQYAGKLSSDALRLGRSEGFWYAQIKNYGLNPFLILPNQWRAHYKLHKRPAKYIYSFAKERFGADLPEHAATAALIAGFGVEKFILGGQDGA